VRLDPASASYDAPVRLRLALAVVIAAASAVPAAAAGGGWAQLLEPDGRVAVSAETAPFDYPRDGSIAHVGSVRLQRGVVILRNVSLYEGTVTARSIAVPLAGRASQVAGLRVDGQPVTAHANTLVLLGGGSYVVAEQTAVDGSGSIGLVGLRLVLNDGQHGVPPGSQLLIGLPSPPRTRHPAAAATTRSQVGVLGLPLEETGGWRSLALPVPVAPPSGPGDRAAALALELLGVPYVWGGARPEVGFDCSGLVMYIYARLGIPLSHFSGAQWNQGMRIPEQLIQPGDLVFFDMSRLGPGHVGISIGGDRFVHAPHSGDIVKVSSLRDVRYGLRYVGAVRPYRR
jgi:hypothetical protein